MAMGLNARQPPWRLKADTDDTCDGYDEDCDGIADEDFVDVMVEFDGVQIYAYEASRPGATAAAPGRFESGG